MMSIQWLVPDSVYYIIQTLQLSPTTHVWSCTDPTTHVWSCTDPTTHVWSCTDPTTHVYGAIQTQQLMYACTDPTTHVCAVQTQQLTYGAVQTQVEQSYKILHSSCIYLARQIGRYLTRILQIARKCTQNEAFLARLGYILARSCTNLAITACKNCVLNGRRARINGSCKVLQDSLQEF